MSRITLTFDNGPVPAVTHYVLDVLAAHDVKATFFIIGSKLLRNTVAREAAERARREGHWIGNHGFYHAYTLGDIDRDDAVEFEFGPAFRWLGDLVDSRKLIRPYCYGGILDRRVFKAADVEAIRTAGYTCVLYNSVPHDWDDEAWDERLLADAARLEWCTTVIHDTPFVEAGISKQPIAKLDSVIRRAKDQGHTFTQEFSPDSVLIAGGEILQPIDHLVKQS